MALRQKFAEHDGEKGHQSLVKEAARFSEEMGVSLELVYRNSKCSGSSRSGLPRRKINSLLTTAVREERKEKIWYENWQGIEQDGMTKSSVCKDAFLG